MALSGTSSEKQPFPYEDSFAIQGDTGSVRFLIGRDHDRQHQGNGCCTDLSCICMPASQGSDAALIPLLSLLVVWESEADYYCKDLSFDSLSPLKIGPRSFFLVCSMFHLHLDEKVIIVLLENLSVRIIRNTPHKGFGYLSCTSGRVYASLCLSPQESLLLHGSHRPEGTHCSCFKLIGSIQFHK